MRSDKINIPNARMPKATWLRKANLSFIAIRVYLKFRK